MSNVNATLYVVATPIGNLGDMTARAIEVLTRVDVIAAEDTRVTGKLLQRFNIATRTVSLHEHNERARVPALIGLLRAGKSIALVSDAGTPLLSDPGFQLVRAARAQGMPIVPIPGACAAIAALSVAGLPTDRFVFEGFPPPRAAARRSFFTALATETRTLIFYESAHRIVDSLADMAQAFGAERPAVIARELTKKFETVHTDMLARLHALVRDTANEQRGEFVVMVHGVTEVGERFAISAEQALDTLLSELPVKQAVALAARLTGQPKNTLYRRALAHAKSVAGRAEDDD